MSCRMRWPVQSVAHSTTCMDIARQAAWHARALFGTRQHVSRARWLLTCQQSTNVTCLLQDEDDLQHGNVGSDNDSELAMSPSPAKRQNTGKLGASAGTAVPSTPQRTNAAAGVCGSGRSKLNMLLDQLAAQRQPSGQPSVGDVLGSMAGGAAVPSAATAAASAGAEVDALEKLRRNNRELKKQVTDLNTTVEALSSEVKEMKAQLELVAGALLND